jgi:hypothetical protein
VVGYYSLVAPIGAYLFFAVCLLLIDSLSSVVLPSLGSRFLLFKSKRRR